MSNLNLPTKLAANLDFNIGQKAGEIGLPMITNANSGASAYQSNFSHLLSSIMSFVMAIAAIMVLLYLLWGAIEWITSAGDKGKLESARNRITQAAVGIIVLSATTAFFVVLQQFLGIKILTFVSAGTPIYSNACFPESFCNSSNAGSKTGLNNCTEDCTLTGNICCQFDTGRRHE
jgi:hypothetical protein